MSFWKFNFKQTSAIDTLVEQEVSGVRVRVKCEYEGCRVSVRGCGVRVRGERFVLV